MKKIFTFCMALVAAMSMSADPTTMTCAEAAAAVASLPSSDGKGTLDDTNSIEVSLTGYVTNTNGNVSKGQQTFYMDDAKGTAKTIQSYWGNLPADDQTPLNVGDQVNLVGRIFNYNGTTPEIKNGTVTIIQRAVVVRDTTEVSVCDAIEIGEALNSGEVSDDYYIVEGVVTMAKDPNTTYNNQTFDLTCADNSKILEGYNVSFENNEYCALGDTVRVLGRLTNYQGSKIEFNGGKAEVIGKGSVVIDTLDVTVAEALAVAQALENGATSKDVYRITGYVDSISSAYSEQHNNISFYVCDDMTAPAYEFQCYRVAGGEDIVLGAKVVVTGKITHYYKAATEEKPEVHGYQTPAGATYELLPTAIINTTDAVKAVKVIENGNLVIIKNGVRYNAAGAQL